MCYKTADHRHRGRPHHRHGGKRHGWKSQMAAAFGYPPVNVKEADDHYEIRLYAAGYEKKDFKVTLEDNILLVAVEKEGQEPNREGHRRRRRMDFQPGNFKRHFELNEKIDKASIRAKYENGVLLLTLQKVAGKETFRQEIEIK